MPDLGMAGEPLGYRDRGGRPRFVAVVKRALGFDGATVVVSHPIQNLTTAELHALADAATDGILTALTDQP